MQGPRRNLAWWARHHFEWLRWAFFAAWLTPALTLGGEWLTGALGINPLQRLLQVTGRWSLVMLLVTLAVTPARRLSVRLSQTLQARYGKRVSDWNWLIRLRRQFGLFAFFYASLHLAVYLALDAGFDVTALRDDTLQRPAIAVGLLAWVLMAPLAATSNQASMRWLGGLWRRLHLLTYPIACLALAHDWLHTKLGHSGPLPYALCLLLLFAGRGLSWRLGDRGAAGEVKERLPAPPAPRA